MGSIRETFTPDIIVAIVAGAAVGAGTVWTAVLIFSAVMGY